MQIFPTYNRRHLIPSTQLRYLQASLFSLNVMLNLRICNHFHIYRIASNCRNLRTRFPPNMFFGIQTNWHRNVSADDDWCVLRALLIFCTVIGSWHSLSRGKWFITPRPGFTANNGPQKVKTDQKWWEKIDSHPFFKFKKLGRWTLPAGHESHCVARFTPVWVCMNTANIVCTGFICWCC